MKREDEYCKFIFCFSEQQELMKAQQDEEKEMLRQFRSDIESRINDYLANPETLRLKLEPMDRIKRKIV